MTYSLFYRRPPAELQPHGASIFSCKYYSAAHAAVCSRLCAVHNEVNHKIHKPEFDCADLDATYDCGCGDAPVGAVPNVPAGDLAGMDLERDLGEDRDTGVKMIKGGR